MMEDSLTKTPNALDVCHFALGCLGFFIGAGGVIISSVCLGVFGLLLILWALAYFAVEPD